MTTPTSKFPLGQTVVTAGVLGWVSEDATNTRHLFLRECLIRHVSGDWGDMCAEDCTTNEDALRYGSRLMSEYNLDGARIWIITEADRSVTTVLFPEEY